MEKFLKNENFFNEFREDFIIFKITQLSMYISSSHSEDYFKMVKLAINEMNFLDSDAYVSIIKRNNALRRYNAIINSNSIREYELNLANNGNNLKINKDNIYINEIERLRNEMKVLTAFSDNMTDYLADMDNNLDLNKSLSNSIKDLAVKDKNLEIPFNHDIYNNSHDCNRIKVLEDRNKYLLRKYNELQNRGFLKSIFKK